MQCGVLSKRDAIVRGAIGAMLLIVGIGCATHPLARKAAPASSIEAYAGTFNNASTRGKTLWKYLITSRPGTPPEFGNYVRLEPDGDALIATLIDYKGNILERQTTPFRLQNGYLIGHRTQVEMPYPAMVIWSSGTTHMGLDDRGELVVYEESGATLYLVILPLFGADDRQHDRFGRAVAPVPPTPERASSNPAVSESPALP